MENENITGDIKANKIKNGEIHKLVYWLRVNTFRRLIEIVGQFWKKGSIKSEPNSSGMKVKEVSVMISKKISVKFNSCCVSYAVKATLDENNTDYLAALDELKRWKNRDRDQSAIAAYWRERVGNRTVIRKLLEIYAEKSFR